MEKKYHNSIKIHGFRAVMINVFSPKGRSILGEAPQVSLLVQSCIWEGQSPVLMQAMKRMHWEQSCREELGWTDGWRIELELWQPVLATQKACHIHIFIKNNVARRLNEEILPLLSSRETSPVSSSIEACSTWETWTCMSRKGLLVQNISCEKGLGQLELLSLEKRRHWGPLDVVFSYLKVFKSNWVDDFIFTWACSNRTERDLNGNLLRQEWWDNERDCPEKLWISHHRNFSKSSWIGFKQPDPVQDVLAHNWGFGLDYFSRFFPMQTILLLTRSWKIAFTHLQSCLQTVSLHGQIYFWASQLSTVEWRSKIESQCQEIKWNSGVLHLK